MPVSLKQALMAPLQQVDHRLTELSRSQAEADVLKNRERVLECIETLKTVAIESRNALLIQLTQSTYPTLTDLVFCNKMSFADALDIFKLHAYFVSTRDNLGEALSGIISFNRYQFEEALAQCIQDTQQYCQPHVAEYLEINLSGRPYTVDKVRYIQGCIRNPRGKKNSVEKQHNNATTLEKIVLEKCPILFTEEDKKIANATSKHNSLTAQKDNTTQQQAS